MKPFAVIIPLLLFALSCDTSEPPSGGEPSVQFAAVDASCTEVWLQVKMLPGVPQRTIRIQRDSTTIFNSTITAADTLIVDEGLLPDRLYRYSCVLPQLFGRDSLNATITTLDTTSHDWSFVVDTIGGPGSLLRDVAIVSERDVWAIGEIYQAGTEPCNVARWNGAQWNLLQIQFLSFCGQPSLGFSPARAVFTFSANDIWISSGSQVVHWNGTTQSIPVCIPVSVNKMWGSNPNSIYAVGVNGQIAHYDGSVWTQMSSPTDVDLLDVWGSPDGSVVWACGHYSDQFGTYLLRYSSGVWEVVYDGTASRFTIRNDSLSGAYSSVFAQNSRDVFVAASAGLYNTRVNAHGEAKRYSFTSGFFPGFPWRVRGDGAELFVVGEYYMVAHFNGATFRHFTQFTGFGRLLSVDQNGNSVFSVGESIDQINSKGIVIRGTR